MRSCITTKHFQLQPEYMGTRRIRVRVGNVPAYLTGNILTAFLSAYGSVEEVSQQQAAAAGTTHRDYIFRVCLNRESFQAISVTIITRDQQMMMLVVESRRPHSWNCKQVGCLARVCLWKNPAATTSEPPKEAVIEATNSVHSAPEPENLKFGNWMDPSHSAGRKKGVSLPQSRRTLLKLRLPGTRSRSQHN